MFIHPVNFIILLSIALVLSLTWTVITARRKPRIAARARDGSAEATSIQQRVAVLEKIVTDPAIRLTREIERL